MTDIIRARLISDQPGAQIPIPGMDQHAKNFGLALFIRWPSFVDQVINSLTAARQETARSWSDTDPMSLIDKLLEWQNNSLSPNGQRSVRSFTERPFLTGAGIAVRGENEGNFFAAVSLDDPKLPAADRASLALVEARTWSEVKSKDDAQMSLFRVVLLEALERGDPPSVVATEMASHLDGRQSDWQTIARTETARALNEGMFATARRLGKDYVYVPSQPGACKHCQRLLVNRVFVASALSAASNVGRKQGAWVAALPLHPNCTCLPIPASDWVVAQALEAQDPVPASGVKIDYKPPSQREV